MHAIRSLAVLLSLFSLATPLRAQDARQQKNLEHAKVIEKLYPTPALQVLARTDIPHDAYQAAVNAAYRAGVPASILNECVATRAMMKGDVAGLQRILPVLKAGLEKYTLETSMFADKADATATVQIIEQALREEEQAPGSVARRARQAGEVAIARKIRAQLVSIDALVDMQSLSKKLPDGTQVAEAQWRSGANPGSYFTTTGADELGNPFGPQIVGKRPAVPKASYDRLKVFVPDSFWSPFVIPK